MPYVGGMNVEGTVIYVDKRLPTKFTTKNGSEVDVDHFLQVHEITEETLERHLDYDYDTAHRIAQAAEKYAVESEGVSWKEYQDFYKPYYKICYYDFTRLPNDLDLSPYIQSGEKELLKKMKEINPEVGKG